MTPDGDPSACKHDELPRYNIEDLRVFCCAVLESLDVPPDDAREVADCLLIADLRGIDSHGVVRLPVYAKRIQAKVVNPRPVIRFHNPYAAICLVEGDNGLGPVVGSRAMLEAIRLAGTTGIGLAGVRRSNHFGAAAHYVEKAVRRDMVGFAASNAPPNMAPFGGRERFLGTNPFAIGIPAGEADPLIFDVSSSVVARGKIIVAAQRNLPIPEGWAVDPEGYPTTDAEQALKGAVLPFGGPKGSGISFIIDILCGVLTGAAFAVYLNTLEDRGSEQNLGNVFAALRIDIFGPGSGFKQRMDEIIRMLKSSPPAPGVAQVLAPGDIEREAETRNRELGVPIAPQTVEQLVTLGQELGVPWRLSPDGVAVW